MQKLNVQLVKKNGTASRPTGALVGCVSPVASAGHENTNASLLFSFI
jgi:hypothetical protein